VRAEFFHADGQIYRQDESNKMFSQFCKAPTNRWHSFYCWERPRIWQCCVSVVYLIFAALLNPSEPSH
jgi:hypothetical protein